MKYTPINSALFIRNREKFSKSLKPRSIAIFHSNDIMPTNADGTMPFRQNNDLYYLSGIDQEETILLLFPDHENPKMRAILFVKETNEQVLIWEGYKLTKDQARDLSGIQQIQWTSSFESVLHTLATEAETIYLNTNEHLRSDNEVETRNDRFILWCKKHYPLHNYERSAPIMQDLRVIKEAEEIDALKQACSITAQAFDRVLGMIKPGVFEYEIEAEIHYTFLKNRSRGPAYGSIIASGADACVLHYTGNDKECKDGDLILMDFGAEYANYNADLTRTVPVNGKFTPRQRAVYDAVLRIMKSATLLLVPGNTLEKYNKEVVSLVEKELIGLGLLKEDEVKNQNPEQPLYRKYFMHGISHYLGLDVHDVGNRNTPFSAGMVFTCEPGLYIREENIGIRLENDILITEAGPVDLMKVIPIEAVDIEKIMSKNRE